MSADVGLLSRMARRTAAPISGRSTPLIRSVVGSSGAIGHSISALRRAWQQPGGRLTGGALPTAMKSVSNGVGSRRWFTPSRPLLIANIDPWMYTLWPSIRDKKLRNVVLPGTHNSGSVNCVHAGGTGTGSLVTPANCQSRSMRDQLYDGIRYFDLRVQPSGDTLYLVHTDAGGLATTAWGIKVDDALRDWEEFVYNPRHSNELIVLSFNHFYGMSEELHQKLVTRIQTIFSRSGQPTKLVSSDRWDEPLSKWIEVGANVVLLYQCDLPFPNALLSLPGKPIWRTADHLYEWYGDTKSSHRVLTGTAAAIDNRRKQRSNQIFNLYGTFTPVVTDFVPGFGSSVQALAKEINPQYMSWLKTGFASGSIRADLNCISVDFYETTDLVQTCIDLNTGRFWQPTRPQPIQSREVLTMCIVDRTTSYLRAMERHLSVVDMQGATPDYIPQFLPKLSSIEKRAVFVQMIHDAGTGSLCSGDTIRFQSFETSEKQGANTLSMMTVAAGTSFLTYLPEGQSSGQQWTIYKVDTSCGVAILPGDAVYLQNVQTKQYLYRSYSDAVSVGDNNISVFTFQPASTDVAIDWNKPFVLCTGDRFHITTSNSEWGAVAASNEWFAKLTTRDNFNGPRVSWKLRFDWNGDHDSVISSEVCTTEQRVGGSDQIKSYPALGNFGDTSSYYYKRGYDPDAQRWIFRRPPAPNKNVGRLRYGEPIHIQNGNGGYLVPNDSLIKVSKGEPFCWFIFPA